MGGGVTRFGFGIVGAGVIATTHAEAIAQVPGAWLAAVTDTSPEAAKRLAASRGCAAEPDLDALLARDDVDIVTVGVPSGLHAEVGVAAATAGKHVIVEKPIDVTLTAADRLIEAARAADVKLTVISQHRFDPGVVELRSLIDDGALGSLLLGEASTKWYRSQAYYDSGTWRGTWALDGGSLMNQGVHYVDLLLACMGPVAEVTAISATQAHEIEVEDVAIALLRFRSGAVGTVVSSTSVFPGLAQRLEISGTHGTVVIEDGEIISRGLASEPPEGQTSDSQPGGQPAGASTPGIGVASHVAQIADFVQVIEHDREPTATAQDGRAALEVVLAVYESARERRTVHIPGVAT
jgi:UDP-N-acetyl-2-amino-2-deoxyglucuronate dehydrogenase